MKKIFSMNRFEGWNLSLPLIQGGMGAYSDFRSATYG